MKIEGISAPIKLIRTNRRTLCVQADKDGNVIIRSPLKLPEKEIVKLVQPKADKIERTVRAAQENKPTEEEIFTNEQIREMAEKAAQIIPRRVQHYAPLVGVTYGRITIRNQRTRWGSCSEKGNLNFNCLLVMTPPEVLDSVVVHELCHRKHMNHSKEFYAEVYRVYPQYDKWNAWLKENGGKLMRRMTDG